MKHLGLLAFITALSLSAPLAAQEGSGREAADTARRASANLALAHQMLEAAETSRDRITALTATLRAYETGLTALRAGLRQVTIRERAMDETFAAKREDITRLLGILATMENAPAPVLMVHPSGPIGTARAGQMVAELTPALQAEAETLRYDLETLQLLRELQETSIAELEAGMRGAQLARTNLAQALSERQNLPRRYISDEAAVAQLLGSARTLNNFAMGLADLPEAELGLPQATQIGALPLPVTGTLLRGFEQSDAAGITRPGWVIAAAPASLVISPSDATIRYAGPLLDYGKVIILEPRQGALLIIAGLNEVYGSAGEIVSIGAPIGLMGGESRQDGDFIAQNSVTSGAQASETLYIETRLNGAPVDPATWFAR